MDGFLEICNNLNRPIILSEREVVTKLLPEKGSHGPDGFSREFCLTFREEQSTTGQKIETEGTQLIFF